jgi:hypothetical protein
MKKCHYLLLCYVQIYSLNFPNIIFANGNWDKCIFPFNYNKRIYTECTRVDSNEPWCVTDQKLFDAAEDWISSNGTEIGWSLCSSSCDVEKEDKECDTSKC